MPEPLAAPAPVEPLAAPAPVEAAEESAAEAGGPPLKRRRAPAAKAKAKAKAGAKKADTKEDKKTEAEAKKAQKAAEREGKKVEKEAQKVAEKAQKEAQKAADRAQKEADKAESARLRGYLKDLGDSIGTQVQNRNDGLTCGMSRTEFDYVFEAYLAREVAKTITTETVLRYGDGREERSTKVQEIAGKIYLSGAEAAGIFGVTKTRGRSYNRMFGQTEWNIVRMQVTPPGNTGRVELDWTLSKEADYGATSLTRGRYW